MKVSVIVPTYRPQGYIWKCLDSLVTQTFHKEDFEVVLVLNGCTEPWKSQIMDYISSKMQGMNVHFIHTEQGGVSNARNIAIDAAQGEYVTFIDDDDYVSPTFLDEMYRNADPDTVVLCYPYAFNDGKPDEQLAYVNTDAYDYCVGHKSDKLISKVRKYFSGPCMKLIPISFIQGKRFDVRFKNGEDSLFMFLISDKIKKIAFASKLAVYYRRYRENSAYMTKRKKWNVVSNELRRIRAYTAIYFSNTSQYDFCFYLTRILGAIKSMIVD